MDKSRSRDGRNKKSNQEVSNSFIDDSYKNNKRPFSRDSINYTKKNDERPLFIAPHELSRKKAV
jgi:hypothetical protein